MESIKDRVLKLIEEKKISKRIFCQSIGVSHSYLNDLKTMQSDKLSKIFDVYPDVNLVWLITGKGEMKYKPQQKMYAVPDLISHPNEAKPESYPVVIDGLKDEVTDLQRKLIRCLEEKDTIRASYEKIYSNVPTEKEGAK